MFKFSKQSLANLETCHHVLQEMCHFAIRKYDFSVICGYRGKEEQDLAFKNKFSKLKFPQSAHNQVPALAVDIIPYPSNWTNILSFHSLHVVIQEFKIPEGHHIIWGGNWESFRDYPHYELIIL